jgi:hypothetical protein
MKVLKLNQYNQGVGKYKLLSSTSGVGSIITTKLGSYILISDINKWRFIKWANSKIEIIHVSYNIKHDLTCKIVKISVFKKKKNTL